MSDIPSQSPGVSPASPHPGEISSPIFPHLTKIVDAALEHPDDTVREALYPVVPRG